MLDVAKQLAQYATRLADTTEPVELADIEAKVGEGACAGAGAGAGGGENAFRLQSETRRSAPRQLLVAAAVAVLFLAAAGVFYFNTNVGDETTDVATDPSIDTEVSVPNRPGNDEFRTGPPPNPSHPTYGYEPGWHELDPGPLAPRVGASTVWARDALIVLGGTGDAGGSGYSPITGTWWNIPDAPLEPAWNIQAQIVWTGGEIIVVRPYPGRPVDTPRQALAYSRHQRRWRELPDAPAATGSHAEMVWTGSEVILTDAAAAFDPGTDTWRSLDLATPSQDATAVWTGELLVIAEPGTQTVLYDPATDATTYVDPPPDHGRNIRGGRTGGVANYGRVTILDAHGRASSLDPATGTWTAEASVGPLDPSCRPEAHALTDGRSVWELCGRTFLRTFHGEWSVVDQPGVDCCLRQSVGTGAVLLKWSGSYEASSLRAWVPPEAPAPRVDLRDGTYQGWIKGVELGPERHVVTIELMEFFFGDEAVEQALAAGEIESPDGLPNPVYSRSVQLPPVSLEANQQAEVWVLEDSIDGHQLATWDESVTDDRHLGLSPSRVTHFPVEIDIRDGIILEIRQFYTP